MVWWSGLFHCSAASLLCSGSGCYILSFSVHCCAVLTSILWYFPFAPLNLSWAVPPQGCRMSLCPLLGGLILLYVIILLESYRKHTQMNWVNLPEHIQLVSKISEIRILSPWPHISLFVPLYPEWAHICEQMNRNFVDYLSTYQNVCSHSSLIVLLVSLH